MPRTLHHLFAIGLIADFIFYLLECQADDFISPAGTNIPVTIYQIRTYLLGSSILSVFAGLIAFATACGLFRLARGSRPLVVMIPLGSLIISGVCLFFSFQFSPLGLLLSGLAFTVSVLLILYLSILWFAEFVIFALHPLTRSPGSERRIGE
jgi:hypothetical protein